MNPDSGSMQMLPQIPNGFHKHDDCATARDEIAEYLQRRAREYAPKEHPEASDRHLVQVSRDPRTVGVLHRSVPVPDASKKVVPSKSQIRDVHDDRTGALLLTLGRAGIELAPHPTDPSRVRHRPAVLPRELSAGWCHTRRWSWGCW